jgi:hypothetical protein
MYRHGEPNEPTKEGLLSFVLFEFLPIHLSFNSQQGPPISGPALLSLNYWRSADLTFEIPLGGDLYMYSTLLV